MNAALNSGGRALADGDLRGGQPRLLGVAEWARLVGLSVWTARSWCYSGRLASVKLGSKLMVPVSEADRIIQENYRPALGKEPEHQIA